jgi:hypothetical protein
MIPTLCLAQNYQWVNTKITNIGTSWESNYVCVYLVGGDVVKVDVTSAQGPSILSMALTAQTSEKKVAVLFDMDGDLLGGCSTGTTIKPYALFRILGK